jgi:hypothetical protein
MMCVKVFPKSITQFLETRREIDSTAQTPIPESGTVVPMSDLDLTTPLLVTPVGSNQ